MCLVKYPLWRIMALLLIFSLQGNCVYQLVGVCISYPGLVPFDVLVQNEFRGSRVVTFTKLLQIIVYNLTIVIDREYSGSVTVSCMF